MLRSPARQPTARRFERKAPKISQRCLANVAEHDQPYRSCGEPMKPEEDEMICPTHGSMH